jgi:hypothetical protein
LERTTLLAAATGEYILEHPTGLDGDLGLSYAGDDGDDDCDDDETFHVQI